MRKARIWSLDFTFTLSYMVFRIRFRQGPSSLYTFLELYEAITLYAGPAHGGSKKFYLSETSPYAFTSRPIRWQLWCSATCIDPLWNRHITFHRPVVESGSSDRSAKTNESL